MPVRNAVASAPVTRLLLRRARVGPACICVDTRSPYQSVAQEQSVGGDQSVNRQRGYSFAPVCVAHESPASVECSATRLVFALALLRSPAWARQRSPSWPRGGMVPSFSRRESAACRRAECRAGVCLGEDSASAQRKTP